MNEIYFQQIEQKIRRLIAEKKFEKAFEICNASIKNFPGIEKFEKLQLEIEQQVENYNQKYIEKKISELQPLKDKKDYTAILKEIEKLIKISPENSKLLKLKKEFQQKYKNEIIEIQKKFETKQAERLQKILDEKPDSLIESLYLLEKNNPGNEKVLDLTRIFRDKFIQRKISEKKELLTSDKFDAIQKFIEDLKKIDNKSDKIKDLENKILLRKKTNNEYETREFYYEAQKNAEALEKISKYSKAIQLLNEIIQNDKDNKTAKKKIKKLESKLFKQTRKITTEIINQNFESLKQEYRKNKNKFIKL